MKNLVKVLALLAIIVIAIILILKIKAIIFGVVLGALGSIVYFSLTGSTLNWKKKK